MISLEFKSNASGKWTDWTIEQNIQLTKIKKFKGAKQQSLKSYKMVKVEWISGIFFNKSCNFMDKKSSKHLSLKFLCYFYQTQWSEKAIVDHLNEIIRRNILVLEKKKST